MSSKLVLFVCDDEHSKLVSLKGFLGEENYKYELIPRTKELIARLDAQDIPDAVFLDLIFEGSDGEPSRTIDKDDIQAIRDRLGKYRPLFIYTQHTDTQKDLLRDIVFEGLADWWLMLEEFESPAAENIKLRLQKALGDYRELRGGLWITQLSDIHFGRQFEHIDRPVGEVLAKLVTRKVSEAPPGCDNYYAPPALTIFSGDMTQAGSVTEFSNAKEFLDEFELKLIEKKVKHPFSIVAPGNHEACRDLSIVAEHTVTGKTIKAQRSSDPSLHSIKWLRFNDAFQKYLSKADLKDKQSMYWAYDLSKRFGCNIYVVNTSFWITYKNDDPIFKSEWVDNLESIAPNVPGILIAHHPMHTWFKGQDADRNLRKLVDSLSTDLDIKLVFSGHKHDPEVKIHTANDQKRIFEVITGSASVSEGEHPPFVMPSFRTINISIDKRGKWESFRTWLAKYDGSNYIYSPQGKEDQFYHTFSWCD